MVMLKISKIGDNRLWLVAALWLCLASGMLYAMADYGSEAGEAGEPPERWPAMATQALKTEGGKPTLIMFAHPLCPCTRATLWELENVTNRLYGMFNTHVLFFEPENTAAMAKIWQATDLKAIANRLPGTTVHVDVDGKLAAHFGAYTSGQVLLYGASQQLLFAGGMTPSRGHTGNNPGKSFVISSILSDSAVDPLQPANSPVFGCSLHSDDRKDDRKVDVELTGAGSGAADAFSGTEETILNQTEISL